MKKRNGQAFITTLISFLCLGTAGLVHGANIGTYDFSGGDPAGDNSTPTNTANVTFSPFTRVNVTTVAANNLFRSASWNLAAAPDTTEYVQFTITPAAGFVVSLERIEFDLARSIDKFTPSEKEGPQFGEVQIFQGLSLTPVASQSFTPVVPSQHVYFDFADFTSLDGEPITVRFYAWAAGHKDGWMDIDNVTVEGSVSPIPEPSAATMMSLGILLFLVNSAMRHRRKH